MQGKSAYQIKCVPKFPPRGTYGDVIYHTGKGRTFIHDGNAWVDPTNAKITLAPIYLD